MLPPSSKLRIYAGYSTSIGSVRKRNDDVYVQRKIPLGYFAAIADGSGANEDGDKAAAFTLVTLLNEVEQATSDPDEALRRGFEAANQYLRAQSKIHKSNLGATCVAAIISGSKLYVAHAGDARGYLLRGANLYALTRDHSVMQELADIKGEHAAGGFVGSLKHMMSRSVGAEDQIMPKIRSAIPLAAGDAVMLCSDGLTSIVTDKLIRRVLAGATPREAAARLVEIALEKGVQDNTTVIVLRVDADACPQPFDRMSFDQLKTMSVQTSDDKQYPIVDVIVNPTTWAIVGLRLDLGALKPGVTCEIPVSEVGPLASSGDVITTPQRSEALLDLADYQ